MLTMSPTYEMLFQNSTKPFFLLCEHASCYIPPEYKNLGISHKDLLSHYGWDIGAFDVFQEICKNQQLQGIYSKFSRLLIDLNRQTQANDLIRQELDPGKKIPGNLQLSSQEKQARIHRYWRPFHLQVEKKIRQLLHRNSPPILIGIHSFTPVLNGQQRKLDIGVLFHPQTFQSPQIAQTFYDHLQQKNYDVQYNQPYSIEKPPHPYPIHHYAQKYQLSYIAIEINNSLIQKKQNAKKIALDLTQALRKI